MEKKIYTLILQLKDFGIIRCCIVARNAQELKEKIYHEYDRLVAEEYASDPLRAQFLPRWYYVRKIITILGDYKSEPYVYQILKLRYHKDDK